MQQILGESFKNAIELMSAFYANKDNLSKMALLSTDMAETFQNGNKILICGNGGSACDAMHFAEEFTGRYREDRRPLPVIHLGDAAHVTCVGNDYGYEKVFSRGVEAYGKKEDWLIGLSTSGNSENVIQAFNKGKELGLKTLALLGNKGGKLKNCADYEFIIPGETSDRIQEVHMTILHILIEGIERILFPENYSEKLKS